MHDDGKEKIAVRKWKYMVIRKAVNKSKDLWPRTDTMGAMGK